VDNPAEKGMRLLLEVILSYFVFQLGNFIINLMRYY